MTHDLEKLTKLAEQLRWRRYEEEKPEIGRMVIVRDGERPLCLAEHTIERGHRRIWGGCCWTHECATEDQWLPLSPLLEYLDGVGR